MPLWVDGIDVGVGGVVLRQHLDQAAAAQVTLDVPFGAHQDSVSIQCPVHSHRTVVGGQIAADSHRFGVRLAATAGGETPQAICLLPLANADAIVSCEI